MGRAPRTDVGNIVYHVLNRANGRMPIFKKPNRGVKVPDTFIPPKV